MSASHNKLTRRRSSAPGRFYRITRTLTASALFALASTTVNGDSLGAAATEPREASWTFNVLLDDRPIGYHRFDLRGAGEVEQVDIEARFEVEVFFITAYRYAHDNRETWRGDCLKGIDSTTNDNGDEFLVRGAAGAEGFSIERNDQSDSVETLCLKTFAYWNPEILGAERLLNAQTGEIKDVTIEPMGPAPFDVGGVIVASDEYLLTMADGAIRLWYEQGSGQWLGLETKTKGDRVLRYEPARLPYPPEGMPLADATGP